MSQDTAFVPKASKFRGENEGGGIEGVIVEGRVRVQRFGDITNFEKKVEKTLRLSLNRVSGKWGKSDFEFRGQGHSFGKNRENISTLCAQRIGLEI